VTMTAFRTTAQIMTVIQERKSEMGVIRWCY
jgi:hypothetical protein